MKFEFFREGKFIEMIKDKQHIERYAVYVEVHTAKSVNSFRMKIR